MKSFAEKEQYLSEHPQVDSIILVAPALHSGRGLGVKKVDDGFKDLLNNIKKSKSLPNNTIKT